MIDLLATARARGEAAVKRAAWTFVSAALLVLAIAFAAAGMVEGLMLVAPAWAAFAASALALAVGAVIARTRARDAKAVVTDGAPEARGDGDLHLHLEQAAATGDWRGLLNTALVRESRDKPARAAAIAAIAGLILGAIEGLDHGGDRP